MNGGYHIREMSWDRERDMLHAEVWIDGLGLRDVYALTWAGLELTAKYVAAGFGELWPTVRRQADEALHRDSLRAK